MRSRISAAVLATSLAVAPAGCATTSGGSRPMSPQTQLIAVGVTVAVVAVALSGLLVGCENEDGSLCGGPQSPQPR